MKKSQIKSVKKVKTAITRRRFVATAAGTVAASAFTGGFPNIVLAADPIRSVGLGVSIINEIQGRAAKDIGFKIRGQALGYGAM
ncbi:MAG: twin-arginine translocation signal domain-containing protein, partial [Rhodospirillales bacterium]